MRYINKQDLLIIARNFGITMIGIGAMCLVPIIIDFIYQECNAVYYLVLGLLSIYLGLICLRTLDQYEIGRMRLKHGMIISTLSWLWACIVCGLILYFATDITIIDGAFESMSALTGSGITIYSDVEILPHSILFFRALQQWVGGLGIIVMILSFLKPGSSTYTLYLSEAREEQSKPSVKTTLNRTLIIYLSYTILGILLYVIAGMPLFDSICNTFCIISTGGMSVKNANIGFYNNELIYFITIFLMILGATSFVIHYKAIKYTKKHLIDDVQFRVMIYLIAVSTLLIYLTSKIVPMDILFTVVSAITTTGASIQSSTVMGGWPPFSIFIIMILMLIGGSTGSTVGAIKLMRVILWVKGIIKNLVEILSPEGRIVPLKINGDKISEKAVAASGNYITLYFLLISFTWALLCLYGHNPFDSLFFTMSMQGNIGLEIGQMSQTLEPAMEVIGMFNMWTGRLEIYPVLISLRAIFEIFRRR